jgi:hypothetical protein
MFRKAPQPEADPHPSQRPQIVKEKSDMKYWWWWWGPAVPSPTAPPDGGTNALQNPELLNVEEVGTKEKRAAGMDRQTQELELRPQGRSQDVLCILYLPSSISLVPGFVPSWQL